MQISSKDNMEVEYQKFSIFNLFNFKLQNIRDVRLELYKPPLKMKESC